jgi:hypothetical protein
VHNGGSVCVLPDLLHHSAWCLSSDAGAAVKAWRLWWARCPVDATARPWRQDLALPGARPMRLRMYPRTGAGCLCELSCDNYAVFSSRGAAELPGLRCGGTNAARPVLAHALRAAVQWRVRLLCVVSSRARRTSVQPMEEGSGIAWYSGSACSYPPGHGHGRTGPGRCRPGPGCSWPRRAPTRPAGTAAAPAHTGPGRRQGRNGPGRSRPGRRCSWQSPAPVPGHTRRTRRSKRLTRPQRGCCAQPSSSPPIVQLDCMSTGG